MFCDRMSNERLQHCIQELVDKRYEPAHMTSALHPWFLSPVGWLEIPAEKTENSSWNHFSFKKLLKRSHYKRRWSKLNIQAKKFFFFRDSSSREQCGVVGVDCVNEVVVSAAPDAPRYALDLLGPGFRFTVASDSEEEMIRWACVIQELIGCSQAIKETALAQRPTVTSTETPWIDQDVPTSVTSLVDFEQKMATVEDSNQTEAQASTLPFETKGGNAEYLKIVRTSGMIYSTHSVAKGPSRLEEHRTRDFAADGELAMLSSADIAVPTPGFVVPSSVVTASLLSMHSSSSGGEKFIKASATSERQHLLELAATEVVKDTESHEIKVKVRFSVSDIRTRYLEPSQNCDQKQFLHQHLRPMQSVAGVAGGSYHGTGHDQPDYPSTQPVSVTCKLHSTDQSSEELQKDSNEGRVEEQSKVRQGNDDAAESLFPPSQPSLSISNFPVKKFSRVSIVASCSPQAQVVGMGCGDVDSDRGGGNPTTLTDQRSVSPIGAAEDELQVAVDAMVPVSTAHKAPVLSGSMHSTSAIDEVGTLADTNARRSIIATTDDEDGGYSHYAAPVAASANAKDSFSANPSPLISAKASGSAIGTFHPVEAVDATTPNGETATAHTEASVDAAKITAPSEEEEQERQHPCGGHKSSQMTLLPSLGGKVILVNLVNPKSPKTSLNLSCVLGTPQVAAGPTASTGSPGASLSSRDSIGSLVSKRLTGFTGMAGAAEAGERHTTAPTPPNSSVSTLATASTSASLGSFHTAAAAAGAAAAAAALMPPGAAAAEAEAPAADAPCLRSQDEWEQEIHNRLLSSGRRHQLSRTPPEKRLRVKVAQDPTGLGRAPPPASFTPRTAFVLEVATGMDFFAEKENSPMSMLNSANSHSTGTGSQGGSQSGSQSGSVRRFSFGDSDGSECSPVQLSSFPLPVYSSPSPRASKQVPSPSSMISATLDASPSKFFTAANSPEVDGRYQSDVDDDTNWVTAYNTPDKSKLSETAVKENPMSPLSPLSSLSPLSRISSLHSMELGMQRRARLELFTDWVGEGLGDSDYAAGSAELEGVEEAEEDATANGAQTVASTTTSAGAAFAGAAAAAAAAAAGLRVPGRAQTSSPASFRRRQKGSQELMSPLLNRARFAVGAASPRGGAGGMRYEQALYMLQASSSSPLLRSPSVVDSLAAKNSDRAIAVSPSVSPSGSALASPSTGQPKPAWKY